MGGNDVWRLVVFRATGVGSTTAPKAIAVPASGKGTPALPGACSLGTVWEAMD